MLNGAFVKKASDSVISKSRLIQNAII